MILGTITNQKDDSLPLTQPSVGYFSSGSNSELESDENQKGTIFNASLLNSWSKGKFASRKRWMGTKREQEKSSVIQIRLEATFFRDLPPFAFQPSVSAEQSQERTSLFGPTWTDCSFAEARDNRRLRGDIKWWVGSGSGWVLSRGSCMASTLFSMNFSLARQKARRCYSAPKQLLLPHCVKQLSRLPEFATKSSMH